MSGENEMQVLENNDLLRLVLGYFRRKASMLYICSKVNRQWRKIASAYIQKMIDDMTVMHGDKPWVAPEINICSHMRELP